MICLFLLNKLKKITMKITAIEFSQEEINQIFDSITEQVDIETSCGCNGQTVDFNLTEEVSIEAKIELYEEWSYYDENHQNDIISRSVIKQRITVFYGGEEVKTNFNESDLYNKIEKYYTI